MWYSWVWLNAKYVIKNASAKDDAYTLFEKSNFCPKIQFCQNFTFFSGNQSCQQLKSANPQQFHEFFTQNFFSRNQSCQQQKSSKPLHFHEFFTRKKSTIFLGKSKSNFWTKNVDFEQYVIWSTWQAINHHRLQWFQHDHWGVYQWSYWFLWRNGQNFYLIWIRIFNLDIILHNSLE